MRKLPVVFAVTGLLAAFMGCDKQPAGVNFQEGVAAAGNSALPPKATIPAALVGPGAAAAS